MDAPDPEPSAATPAPASREAEPRAAGATDTGGLVLVVDDDEDFAGTVAEFLERRGHAVAHVATASDALPRLSREPVAVVLLDLVLPDMSGLEMMRLIQRQPDPPEVIIVSGQATPATALDALEAGSTGFIFKPVHLPRLANIVARIIGRRKLAAENARLNGELRRRLREREAFLTVASTLSSTLDVQEAFRRICRALTQIAGADTAAAYLHDTDRDLLVPHAGYHVPAELLGTLLGEPLPLKEQGFYLPLWNERRPVLSDDVAGDARFGHRLFRLFHHQSGLVLPLVLDDAVAGAFYLVWWTERVSLGERELTLLQSMAGQVAPLLRNARLFSETQAQRQRLTQIFESTSDGIMLVNRAGVVEAANPRASELLGIPVPTGAAITALVPSDAEAGADQAGALQSLRALVDHPDKRVEGDLELRRAARVVHWVSRPTVDTASGETIGFTLTLQDVTREREVGRMKSDFVSFATHQLRTPLAGIRWMLDLASQEEGVPEEAASFILDARSSATRLIALVNDLLDVASLEQGRIRIEPRLVDLAAVTQGVLADVATLVAEKQHEIAVEEGAEPLTASSDPQLLRQVILNLLSNAIKYTPAGGTVHVAMGRALDDALRWEVRDTGIGIPVAAQARLFEKFYRADNAATLETEGTGLGLYLVRLIVEQLGGRVWCHSEEGVGSTFGFTLPAVDPA